MFRPVTVTCPRAAHERNRNNGCGGGSSSSSILLLLALQFSVNLSLFPNRPPLVSIS